MVYKTFQVNLPFRTYFSKWQSSATWKHSQQHELKTWHYGHHAAPWLRAAGFEVIGCWIEPMGLIHAVRSMFSPREPISSFFLHVLHGFHQPVATKNRLSLWLLDLFFADLKVGHGSKAGCPGFHTTNRGCSSTIHPSVAHGLNGLCQTSQQVDRTSGTPPWNEQEIMETYGCWWF